MIFHLKNDKKPRNCYLAIILLLFFVLIDEVSDTFLVKESSRISASNIWIHEYSLVCLLLGLQTIFSCLQSGFSDYYLRKKSLTISFLATFISIFFLKIASVSSNWILIVAIFIKGAIGNTLPIAWSGISDEAVGKNIRFFLGLSICALATGSWTSLIAFSYLTSRILYWSVITILLLAILLTVYYSDPADNLPSIQKNNTSETTTESLKNMSFWGLFKKECLNLYQIGKKPLNFLCLNAFLFSEISFYQILFRIEVFETYECFIRVPLAIGIGYTSGTIALKLIESLKDRLVSAFGILTSIIAILMASIFFGFGYKNQIIFTFLFACYSFGYSWFTPALFSMIMTKEPLHNQGKGYGLLDSADSLASLITFILIFKTNTISCSQSLIISFILMIISGIIFLMSFINDKNYKIITNP